MANLVPQKEVLHLFRNMIRSSYQYVIIASILRNTDNIFLWSYYHDLRYFIRYINIFLYSHSFLFHTIPINYYFYHKIS